MPMDYQTLVRNLEVQHPEYTLYAPYWRTIRDLKEGTIAISRNLEKYLPMRPDEDQELYRMRLAKLSYTPVMADAVNKYSSKLAGSPVHLSNAEDPFWAQFRANNNHPSAAIRSESGLLHEMFNGLLYYGRIWVEVNRPNLGLTPKSAYEARGLPGQPYCTIYDPSDVPYWGDDWCIIRHLYPQVQPFEPPRTICRWTLYTPEENIVYETPVQLKAARDAEGNLYETLDKVWIGNRWLPWDDNKAVLEPTQVWKHGYQERLVVTLGLPTEKWVCKQVYIKQIQHLRIENAWTDAGYLSGIVQRLFIPPDVPPADDPRVVYEQPDYAKELAKAGNSHILIGNGYQFVESTGAALSNLQQQLDKIEAQIRSLVSLHFASGDALQQSGISKLVDMSLLEDSMKSYGQQVLTLYNSVLRIVARMMQLPEPVASGLSSYSVNNTNDLLKQLSAAEELPYVPPTAKKIAYGKLAQLLAGIMAPKDEERIRQELDELFLDNPSVEDLMDTYGMTKEEAEYVLGGATDA